MLRRRFLQTTSIFATGFALAPLARASSAGWHMPDEADPHTRTWMSFGANAEIWGEDLLPEVQRNLAAIANAIARFEPVSMLVNEEDYEHARSLVSSQVELVVCPVDDLWIRDSGPVFVKNDEGERAGIDFNFNGWGNKQEHAKDAEVAAFVCQHAGVPRINTTLVLEGGGIEVDGQGTAIIVESCVLNDNRNPGVSKAEAERELKKLLGLQKIIWLPGIKGKDITDAHTDFYARFTSPGTIVAALDTDPDSYDHAVTKRHLEILKTATDANGRKLKIVILEAPTQTRPTYASDSFAAGYLNFYVCNGGVIIPQFGDAHADKAAFNKIQSLFPKHKVVQVAIDGIAAGGGGIHCATQQEIHA